MRGDNLKPGASHAKAISYSPSGGGNSDDERGGLESGCPGHARSGYSPRPGTKFLSSQANCLRSVPGSLVRTVPSPCLRPCRPMLVRALLIAPDWCVDYRIFCRIRGRLSWRSLSYCSARSARLHKRRHAARHRGAGAPPASARHGVLHGR